MESNVTKLKSRVEKGSRNESVYKVGVGDSKELKKNRRERLGK